MTKKPKPKRCRECREYFTPTRAIMPVCDTFECKVAYATKAANKMAQNRLIKEKRETKAKIEQTKTASDYLPIAQEWFNRYIRYRDIIAGFPCICCDRPLNLSAGVGGMLDAGHWRTRKAASQLRFNEDNVHAQNKYCNRYKAGNQSGMEAGMRIRIGDERVDALKYNNTQHTWTLEELKSIIVKYKAKCKELKPLLGEYNA